MCAQGNKEIFETHRLQFLKHRQKILNAQSMVDDKSPDLRLSTMMNPSHLKTDSNMFERILRSNIDQLIQQNRIARTRGLINSFPHRIEAIIGPGKVKAVTKRIIEMEKTNLEMGNRILCATTELSTRWPVDKLHHKKAQHKNTFKLPETIIAKYTNLQLPSTKQLQQKLLRPRIYIELAVKDVRPLGRINIQLYTEASPQVVMEFVRICHSKSKDNIKFLRLFPSLWLEGELLINTATSTTKRIEYDMRALDHGTSAGILSFSRRFLNGFKCGFVNFSISFKPLRVLNNCRVAFGEVQRGLKILDCIQDYGTKNGKPTKQIIVTDCGMYL